MVTPALPWAACSNAQQPFGEEIVPKIQPQPPLAQLEAVSSHPMLASVWQTIEMAMRDPTAHQSGLSSGATPWSKTNSWNDNRKAET